MSNSVNHEDWLVKAFIPPHRQERFLEIVAKPKKRAKLLKELYHFDDLNPECMVAIPRNQQDPAAILKLLRAKGAGPKCLQLQRKAWPPVRQNPQKRRAAPPRLFLVRGLLFLGRQARVKGPCSRSD